MVFRALMDSGFANGTRTAAGGQPSGKIGEGERGPTR
jgi:hypothetical protein